MELVKSTSTGDIDDEPKPSYLMLLKGELLYPRILIIFATVFMLLLSMSYTIGQILSLELSNFWCPQRTAEDILKHSIDINENGGDNSGCWSAKSFQVDNRLLWSTSSYGYSRVTDGVSYFKFSLFLFISVVFLIVIIFYSISLITDIKAYRARLLGVKQQYSRHNKFLQESNQQNISPQTNIYHYYTKYSKWYNDNLHHDTSFWCLMMFIREIFEIAIQSQALLYYNGYTLSNDLTLAYDPKYVKLFTVILSMNAIFFCILWWFYSLKPYICFGFVFELLLYCFDVAFDILYTLFPLIVVLQSNDNVSVALAALQTDTLITFIATFIPLLFLCWSSYSFSWYARDSMLTYYGNIFLSSKLENKKYENKALEMMNLSNIHYNEKTNENILQSISYHTKANITSSNWVISKQNVCRNKTIILIVSSLFGIYGIVLLSVVFNHFNSVTQQCSMVTNELNNLYYSNRSNYYNNSTDSNLLPLTDDARNILQSNHELIFWDKCLFKVYPFGYNNKCQCRIFRLQLLNNVISVNDLRYHFNIELVDVLRHVLLHWNNLEKFRWSSTKTIYRNEDLEPPKLNLTAGMFDAKYLRIFSLDDTPIGYIDEKINNWQLLTFFRSRKNDDFTQFPASFNKLKELKYFEFMATNVGINNFPQQICELKKLRFIKLQNTNITSIPLCVTKLDEIEALSFGFNTNLKWFPLDILTMKKLWKFDALTTNVDLKSLMEHNGFSDEKEFDRAFNYKNQDGVSYSLQDTVLCDNYYNNGISSDLTNILSFINSTGCCKPACDSHYKLDRVHCAADIYQDGVCNTGCDRKACNFDGGDCNQLCSCSYLELGDGYCNTRCNTTNCDWDKYDCIQLEYNKTLCEVTYIDHGCNTSWVGDGFCDGLCKDNTYCGNDQNDCQGCGQNFCGAAYDIFSIAANSQTNDDYLSLDEVCSYWNALMSVPVWAEGVPWKNCSDAMQKGDINKDNHLSFYEILAATPVVNGITVAQAEQLDCSLCTGKDKYY